jgi:hypothetical protein
MLPSQYEPQRQRIHELREACKKMPMPVWAQAVANYIITDEQSAGSRMLVIDNRPHIFSARRRQLLEIGKERKFDAYLLMVYGLNVKDQVVGFVVELLKAYALWHGEKRKLRRWAEFREGVLYLSNYDGRVWKITGDGVYVDGQGKLMDDLWPRHAKTAGATPPVGIGLENNGEHVVFADDDGGKPVEDPIIGRNGKLFKILGSITWAHETAGGLTPKEQAQTLLVWMFAVAFPDLFPTKPLLIAEGAPGSGKSTVFQMLQAMLHGRIRPLIISEDGLRDFWVGLLRSPIAVLDNTDDLIKWLPDQIAAYTTGGGRPERELHTNTGEVYLEPQSFIAVASKNPMSFRRDDVADRSIVLRMERRPPTKMESIGDIMTRISAERPELFGEWLYYLNRVVAAINLGKKHRVSHRMGDWNKFAYAVGEAFRWPEERIVALMEAIQRERVAFAAENDVVLEVLETWIEANGGVNSGRPVTARDLFKELAMTAQYDGKMFVKTPQALAQRLRSPHVNEKFMIATELDRDRKVYRITPAIALGEQN